MQNNKQLRATLKQWLQQQIPVAEFSVTKNYGGIRVSYYGGDTDFDRHVKSRVAEFFGADGSEMDFTRRLYVQEMGEEVYCDWCKDYKPVKIFSRIISVDRTPSPKPSTLACWDELTTTLSCGHKLRRDVYRNKEYAISSRIGKRICCWECTLAHREQEIAWVEQFRAGNPTP